MSDYCQFRSQSRQIDSNKKGRLIRPFSTAKKQVLVTRVFKRFTSLE